MVSKDAKMPKWIERKTLLYNIALLQKSRLIVFRNFIEENLSLRLSS